VLREDLAGQAPRSAIVDPARLRAVRRLAIESRADPAFDRIAQLVERLVDVPVALVTVVGADRQHLAGQVGLPEPLAGRREMPLTHSFSRHVVEQARSLIVEDVRTEPRMRDNRSIAELGAVAFAGLPLTDSEGLVLGALTAMDREPRAWTRSEIALLTDLAEVCSSELRLRIAREIADEARRHVESAHDQLILLGELTEAIAATMDVDEAMGRLARMVAGRLADWCFVTLADPSGAVRHTSAAHADPRHAALTGRLAEISWPNAKAVVLAVQRTGHLVRQDDADPAMLRHGLRRTPAVLDAEPPDPAETTAAGDAEGSPAEEIAGIAERLGFRSFLIVPITAPATGRILGAALLVNGATRGVFSAAQERTAAEIGRRAGLAVDNSRLYGRQRHLAEVLQRSMLPELPRPPGMELRARYLPAQAGAAVGGDWYDAFVQPDGSLMVAVGDVSGHDIEAAATMGQVRNLIRGDAYGRTEAPGPLLARLDQTLHGLGVPAAATAVLARLCRDGDGYEVGFANAGHPPPLLLRPDGAVDVWWETPEPLLGLMPRTERSTHHRRVRPGSTLLLYTDGLVEHPAQILDDGIARVRAVLHGNADLAAEELCERLVRSASRRADDIALLLIKLR
jgi:serine phosphatase RsbU (regulator of sigma subunit)